MAETEEKDLKPQEDDTSGDQSNSDKNDSEADGGLKNKSEETAEQVAARLLKDGSSPTKEIRVNKDKFDDRNEKAKIYEAYAPVLDKLLKNPELLEKLSDVPEKDILEERVARIEEAEKDKQRREMRSAVTDALSKWSNFEESWEEVKPLAESLAKRGLPYGDALRRAYFAINPEAAVAERETFVKENANHFGVTSSSYGYSPKPMKIGTTRKLTSVEQQYAKGMKLSDEAYVKLLEKHEAHMRARGFYDSRLEIEL